MRRIGEFLAKHIVKLIVIALFITPFFWYKIGQIDLGGDSTRFYIMDARPRLQNIAFYAVNPLSSMGNQNLNFFMIPFLSILVAIQTLLGHNVYLINCSVGGIVLASSFYFCYLSILELLPGENKNKTNKTSAIIGGLMFALSPTIFYYDWVKALIHIYSLGVYPAIFWLFLKYMKKGEYKYIIYSGFVSLVFAVLFSMPVIPWTIAFFSFAFLFLWIHSVTIKKQKIFWKGFGLFTVFVGLVNIFHLAPTMEETFNASSNTSELIFDKAGKIDRGLNYFISIYPYSNVIDNMTNQTQNHIATNFGNPIKDTVIQFGQKFEFLYIIYVIIIILAGILVKKSDNKYVENLYFLLIFMFLLLMFFFTANINDASIAIYSKLFDLPGFSMFRSFYSKFNIIFAFFYAILFGISTNIVANNLNMRIRKFYNILIIIIIIFNAIPFLRGDIANETLWKSNGIKIPIIPTDNFKNLINYVQNEKLNAKFLSLPLTNEEYQIIQGKDGGAYFGPSSISRLGGKCDFNGLGSFKMYSDDMLKFISDGDYDKARNLISMLNIGYVIYNTDDYIYDNFPSYPYGDKLKQLFLKQYQVREFLNNLGFEKIKTFGNFELYFNKGFFPKVYVPEKIITTNFNPEDKDFINKNYLNTTTAFFSQSKLSKIPDQIYKNSDIYMKMFESVNDLTGALEHSEVNEKFFINKNAINKNFDLYKIINSNSKINIQYFGDPRLLIIKILPSNNIKINNDVMTDATYHMSENYLQNDAILSVGNQFIKLGSQPINVDTQIGEDIYLIEDKPSPNVIPNGSFEKGPWKDDVSDCTASDSGKPIINQSKSSDASDGQYSLELYSKNHFACTNQSFSTYIVKDNIYKFSFDYKISKGPKGNAYIKMSNSFSDQSKSIELTGTFNEWHHFETYIKADSNYDNLETFLYAQTDGSFESDIKYDNLSFRKMEITKKIDNKTLSIQTNKNLKLNEENKIIFSKNKTLNDIESNNIIPNGSFEKGPWKDNVSDCTASNPGRSIISMEKSDDHTDGQQSLQLSAQNHIACTNQTINSNFVQGKVYKISLDYKVLKGKEGAAYIKMSNKFKSLTNTISLTGTFNEWHTFKTYITPDANYDTLEIFLYAGTQENNEATIRYDNIKAEELLSSDIFDYYFQGKVADKIEKPTLEFRQITPTKYRVIIKSAKNPFPLILSNYFNKNRKLYIKDYKKPLESDITQNLTYSTSPSIPQVSATKEDIVNYLNKGRITNINTDDKNKISFVGKNIDGSVQNNNLPDGGFFETFFASKIDNNWNIKQNSIGKDIFELGDANHGAVNEYANSWWIDTDKICSEKNLCYKNPDGSYDIEIIAEFKIQKLFFISSLISIFTTLTGIGYLIYIKIKKNEKI